MKRQMIMALCAVSSLALVQGKVVELFNGRDLSGWKQVVDKNVTGGYSATESTWFVADGTIRTTGTPFGYLRTERDDFANYRLHVEYRWWRKTEKPNSGIFVCLAKEHGTFIPTTIENQLCQGSAGDVLGLAGFRFAGLEPRNPFDASKPLSGITKVLRRGADVEKPFGEWNVIEVELQGDTLVNRVNGIELNRVTGLSIVKGAIGLQSEGGAAEFRNIRLEEIPSGAASAKANLVKVSMDTSSGMIELELDAEKAPVTVANFVEYAKAGYYDGTIFHRVINGFMIQGGGFMPQMVEKETRAPIKNEAANGLKNARGTIAMARTMVVDSATSQFFINLKDNSFLDYTAPNPRQFGYAVFGRVTKGMDVVDQIAQVKTGSHGFHENVPVTPVVIRSVRVAE